MDREPIEVTRADRIYCLKASSDYHSEVCEECKYYPNCDHMTQDDMTEVTIRDLEKLEKIEQIVKQVESLHPEVAIGDREGIRKIKEVLEQE